MKTLQRTHYVVLTPSMSRHFATLGAAKRLQEKHGGKIWRWVRTGSVNAGRFGTMPTWKEEEV
jgi:hypothetical protein